MIEGLEAVAAGQYGPKAGALAARRTTRRITI